MSSVEASHECEEITSGMTKSGASYGSRIDQLLDLELPLSVVLGRALLPIHEVLRLTTGSIIELDTKVGDAVEVMVHGKVVARGQVVSVDGNYGVRITHVTSTQDRMKLPGAFKAA
ncbi:MAG: FliM/FliN family flagellar motor switch protein [Acidobacteriaceae bacterium]|nr:FliM/FliN family flagellar motor switch protein [Acidobacteriaceae bacterium]MBV8572876.1 FliM/FliN family flagellar motor switch protein [Acidobacteriaceae bacterium]